MTTKKTFRITVDIPAEQHAYIKELAAKEGVTLEQFVMEHLPALQKREHQALSQDEFNELLEDLLDEKEPVLKRLSKK